MSGMCDHSARIAISLPEGGYEVLCYTCCATYVVDGKTGKRSDYEYVGLANTPCYCGEEGCYECQG